MEFPQGWYAAISSNEVVSGKPTAVRRFGQDLVAWRDGSGNPVVMEDMCPHRSVKLSLGTVKAGTITCAFHGFKFGSDGGCLLVPETAMPAPNLRCLTVRSSESHGFIWLWHGADEDATPTYAHLPYVHATTIGGGFNISDPDLSFELDENAVKLQMGKGHFVWLCCKNSKIDEFQIIKWLNQAIPDHQICAEIDFCNRARISDAPIENNAPTVR